MKNPSVELDVSSLPTRQREVLRLIGTLSEEHGYPPTLAELAQAMGLKNRMTVHQHVAALKKKGFVQWEQGLNRSLRILGGPIGQRDVIPTQPLVDISSFSNSAANSGIPFAGSIAAGTPIDAVARQESIHIDQHYADQGCFALKVKGDSMIEEGILDGDFVIIKPNPSPQNGEMVVALLSDGSATLKRFFKERGQFRLQPSNKDYKPILIDREEGLTVQGTVVALYRKLH